MNYTLDIDPLAEQQIASLPSSAIAKERLSDPLVQQLAGQPLAITFVTVGDLTQWTFLRGWGPQRKADLDRSTTAG